MVFKHRITYKVDNSTPYTLYPNGQYAYWGNTVSGPERIDPMGKSGNAGVIQASAAPWTGAAGISGYVLKNPQQQTLAWFTILGSDPDWSSQDNRARVNLSSIATTTDKDNYNRLFDGSASASLPMDHGQLEISGYIGDEDDCTATFELTFKKGTGVTAEALGLNLADEGAEQIFNNLAGGK